MKKILAASTTTLAVFVLPAVAQASTPTRDHVRQYVHDYALIRHQFGPKVAGCRLIGVHGHCHAKTTDEKLMTSLGVLHRMLAPPPAQVATPSSTSSSYATPSSSSATGSSGGYSIPSSIVQCESGGNYSAVNSSSGAGGAYQIMPSTWNGYDGYPNAQSAPPAVQDQKAAQIWNGGAGRSQWSC